MQFKYIVRWYLAISVYLNWIDFVLNDKTIFKDISIWSRAYIELIIVIVNIVNTCMLPSIYSQFDILCYVHFNETKLSGLFSPLNMIPYIVKPFCIFASAHERPSQLKVLTVLIYTCILVMLTHLSYGQDMHAGF